jgi:hypothetical protein
MRSRGTIGQLSLLGGDSAHHNENAAPANAPTHTPSCSSVCISSALALNRGNKRSDPLGGQVASAAGTGDGKRGAHPVAKRHNIFSS